jgi:hypothetical protein
MLVLIELRRTAPGESNPPARSRIGCAADRESEIRPRQGGGRKPNRIEKQGERAGTNRGKNRMAYS